MKKILATLSILTIATTIASLNTILNASLQQTKIAFSETSNKTQEDTIYIDEITGQRVTTSEIDLSNISSKEVVQIGFYQNEAGQIQAVRMPINIEKVPIELPPAITSLERMFAFTTSFNQDLSSWNTSNVTDMSFMFYNAESFNQDLSKWNVTNVASHLEFANHSEINNTNKLPKFNK